MRITFDREFDGGAWPGPLHGVEAVAGEAWVGEAGLLGLLEAQLGRTAPWDGAVARAAALVPTLRATEGFWSRSVELDPLGSAQRILHWRDELRMHGWKGPVGQERLDALARVTREVAPGPPDRWEAIGRALERQRACVEEIRLFEPPERLPLAMRRVLDQLAAQGTNVRVEPLSTVAAAGDLGASKCGRFRAQGDGSLQLLRPWGPMQAAEQVAAWLAARDSLDGTVIVGGDALLDGALRRFGLPTTGSGGRPAENALLQVLPLVLALGWKPPDPQRALDLLTLQVSPIPAGIARRLVKALHEHPAVGSRIWCEALEAGLARIEEPARRDEIRERIGWVFSGHVDRAVGYGAAELGGRLAALQRWMQGRMATAADPAPWQAALTQIATLGRLVQLSGLRTLPESVLHRFVEEASAAAGNVPLHPAQAGIAAVAGPGSVAGPARRVVWWRFWRSAAPAPHGIPLSREERATLAAAGVAIPSSGDRAIELARRWRRPLQQATESLLLVCPMRDEAGEADHPHPLWDEIGTAIEEGRERLVVAAPMGVPMERRRFLPAHGPRREWGLPAGVVKVRDKESPSSLERLLGCSFAWTLQYVGELAAGASAALPHAEKLVGTAVHAILARLLAGPMRTPDEAAAEARRLFETEGPLLAASLFLPGADVPRARAARATEEAAREIYRLLREGGLRIVSVEAPYRKAALGTELEGTPDLVVEGRDGGRFPIDLKRSGTSHRRRSLERGSALQLAAYSFLVADGREPQDGAYFILVDQRLLTRRTDLATGRTVEGPSAVETWAAASVSHRAALEELQQGRAVAAAAAAASDEEASEEGIDEEGRLVLAPPCRFCDYPALCGRIFGGT